MRKSLLCVLISTLMFSSMEIVLKAVSNQFSPIQLNLIRFFIGGLVLLPLANHHLKRAGQKLMLLDWLVFALTGFLCIIVSMTLYQLAIVYGKPATIAVLFSCNPVFALIFAFLILHEKLNRASMISLVISVIGLLIIVNPANLTNPVGTILGILSALTFGLYSIISRWGSILEGFDGITMTAYTFIAGSAELFVLVLLTHVRFISNAMNSISWMKQFANIPVLTNVNLAHFGVLFFIGVCVTGGGFAFYFLAMELDGVSIASLVFFIKPALAPILAMITIHEKMTTPMLVGIVVILIGSVVTFIGNRVSDKELKNSGVVREPLIENDKAVKNGKVQSDSSSERVEKI
ncbi:DMT family transporter [Lentilactobacillus hilgardii]|uniref:DMT family transporter n=1 Tax=Lentilactobacillus hilgardii TaxID=1588 RepID=UPI0021A63A52|nr:DMT family transporter [Lentilactobacillus hilgardii]MCT3400344.1 EamA family transporter [Lentilactobacillus hilgardii]